ncbi:MAG: CHAP domain-containing protein [Candidatus Saccharimonadales bacterium]
MNIHKNIFAKLPRFFLSTFRVSILLAMCIILPATSVAGQTKYDWEYYCVDQVDCALYDPNFVGCGNTGAAQPGAISTDVTSEANARAVIGVAKTLNMGIDGAIIGLMAGITESGLQNYASLKLPLSQQNPAWLALPEPRPMGNDGHSVGIMQQQVQFTWSTIATGEAAFNNKDAIWQLMNPTYAAQAFFGSPPGSNMPPALMKGVLNKGAWQGKPPHQVAQSVQGSAFADGSNYQKNYSAAVTMANAFYESTPPAQLVVPLNSGVGGGTGPNATAPATNPGLCAGAGAVNINCTPPATEGSPAPDQTIRSKIVCLAQSELALWDSGQMKPGTDFYKYSQGRGEEWCADFTSWLYNQAGLPINGSPPGNVPGVLGIYTFGNNRPDLVYNPSNGGYTPRPGDMAIHSSAGNAYYHVNLVTAVSGNNVTIIGGNQAGTNFNNSKVNSYDMVGFNAQDTIGYVGPR